jgi:phosphate transport system permease protein
MTVAGRASREGWIRWVAFFCALISVATTFGIVWTLLSQALPFFRAVPLGSFLGGVEWRPTAEPPAFGILPLVAGTLLVTVGAGLIAIPLGLLVAIYLSEYAHPRIRGFLKPALELLAGIPTVVYGYLGLFLVTPALKQIWPETQTTNAAAGAIVVGIMILPFVSSLCEDALEAVPKGLREAAIGLGSTKGETIARIVLPSSMSRVMASFILALSRAMGETMAVALAAGANPNLTFDPRRSVETMSAFIVSTSEGDAAAGTTKYTSLFAVAVVLFFLTLLMHVAAGRAIRRIRG